MKLINWLIDRLTNKVNKPMPKDHTMQDIVGD